jgi:hypothetical protein
LNEDYLEQPQFLYLLFYWKSKICCLAASRPWPCSSQSIPCTYVSQTPFSHTQLRYWPVSEISIDKRIIERCISLSPSRIDENHQQSPFDKGSDWHGHSRWSHQPHFTWHSQPLSHLEMHASSLPTFIAMNVPPHHQRGSSSRPLVTPYPYPYMRL